MDRETSNSHPGVLCSSRRAFLAAVPMLGAAACATPRRLDAVPAGLTAAAEPAVPGARYLPERNSDGFAEMAVRGNVREEAWLRSQGHTGSLPPAAYLAISGGGGDGAFGAGLLTGWTEAGDRPTFKLVTGVSTGALIAPFAFVGPKYDPVLRVTYTSIDDKAIFRKRNLLAALFDDAIADTKPMARLLEKYVTHELLADISAEYAKGRLLLVGTTNLDAREPVYWDMGAIAAAGGDESLKLFRKITLASASIPGAFPPVMIDVIAAGKRYQEMHVDGGATRQVFMYPQSMHLGALTKSRGWERKRTLYIIRNARLDADWSRVDRRTLSIMGRAVSSLIQTQGVGDLIRMALTARRDGLDYNLAYVPSDFNTVRRSEFDLDYMRPLFERARTMARAGYVWTKYPPGYDPEKAAIAG